MESWELIRTLTRAARQVEFAARHALWILAVAFFGLLAIVIFQIVWLVRNGAEAKLPQPSDTPSGNTIAAVEQMSWSILWVLAVLLLCIGGIVWLIYRDKARAVLATLRPGFDPIRDAPRWTVSEPEVQVHLRSFSDGAERIKIIAGDADFLETDPAQFEELRVLGKRCMMLTRFGEVGQIDRLSDLIKQGVTIRSYVTSDMDGLTGQTGALRGRIRESTTGLQAMLFDRVDGGFRIVDLENAYLVSLIHDEYQDWFARARNPLVRHIIFGMSGVILDRYYIDFADSVAEILGETGLARANDETMFDEQLFLGHRQISDVIADRIGRTLTPNELEAIESAWLETWNQSPDFLSLARRLKESGYVVSLAGNCDEGRYVQYQRQAMFEDFDHHFLSFQRGFVKPQPDFWKMLLNELDARPFECLLIDDDRVAIESAKGLGISTIRVRRNSGGSVVNSRDPYVDVMDTLNRLAVRPEEVGADNE